MSSILPDTQNESKQKPLALVISTFLFTIIIPIVVGQEVPLQISPTAEPLSVLNSQADLFKTFEAIVEVQSFEIENATSSFSFADTEKFFQYVATVVDSKNMDSAADLESGWDRVVDRIGKFFQGKNRLSELSQQVHQRDSTRSIYRIWDKDLHTLSIFDSKGSWYQDASDISLGPVVNEKEVEVYISRLGLIIPREATYENKNKIKVGSATQSIVFSIDLESSRFRYHWNIQNVSSTFESMEEFPLWEDKLQGIWEKRVWFQYDPNDAMNNPLADTNPSLGRFINRIGVIVRYNSDGSLASYSIQKIHAIHLNPSTWEVIPVEKPVVGLPVLDYRFSPEIEYKYGFYQ